MVKASHVSHLAQEEEDAEDDEEYDGQDDGEGQPRVSQLQNIVQVVRGQVHLQDILRGFRICGHPDIVQPKKSQLIYNTVTVEKVKIWTEKHFLSICESVGAKKATKRWKK